MLSPGDAVKGGDLTVQEKDQLNRSKKKPKVVMEGSSSSRSNPNETVPVQPIKFQTTIGMSLDRKVVSYKDIFLGVNGHNISEDDAEMFEEDRLLQEQPPVEEGSEGNSAFLGDPLCPVVKLTEAERDIIRIPWKRAILVKVLGKHMSLRYFHGRLIKLWRPKARTEVIDIDYEYFIICGGSRVFFPPEDDLQRVAVWIRIPGLAIEFYDRRVLWRIGNVLGKTVKIDANTLREKADAQVWSLWPQKKACPLSTTQDKPNEASNQVQESVVHQRGAAVEQAEGDSFGPWMTA
ncbi:hypothetical protein SESBI_09679 [Sesbania bispinosa]|nr:hypothetical protein SESBI_09679 [Sesbania bispinosa]